VAAAVGAGLRNLRGVGDPGDAGNSRHI
jgi:hypothetical protein